MSETFKFCQMFRRIVQKQLRRLINLGMGLHLAMVTLYQERPGSLKIMVLPHNLNQNWVAVSWLSRLR